MKRNFLLFLALSALSFACSTEPEGNVQVEEQNSVRFNGHFGSTTRATETSFEVGDAISLFAVDPQVSNELKASGNYADNVKYTYASDGFKAGTKGVVISDSNKVGYAYYAVYPYSTSVDNSFTFVANSDQSSHTKYTASDLCTAYNEPTASQTVELEFFHRMSNVVVKFTGNNIASKGLVAELNDVLLSCSADLNNDTFLGTGSKQSVEMYEQTDNNFVAIIAPQRRYADEVFMTVTMNGTEYGLTLARDIEFKSGYEVVFELKVTDDSITEINGKLNPWENRDDRLEEVVPPDILADVDDYMPINRGINPPIIEGTYYAEPLITVYCSDFGYDPGDEVLPIYLKFSNQNTKNNTLDIYQYDDWDQWLEGKGAFISGSGNDFTAYFNTEGEDGDIYMKTALVISGTWTSSGIKNLYFAAIMVDKRNDIEGELMEIGTFRIYTDDMSYKTSSRALSMGLSDEPKWSIFSYNK